MRASGYVRHTDRMGRIVVPQSIRDSLNFGEGDNVEFFVEENKAILIKKVSPLKDIADLIISYADTLNKSLGYTICVTDRYQIKASSGQNADILNGKNLAHNVLDFLEARELRTGSRCERGFVSILQDDRAKLYDTYLLAPIISEGYACGSILFLSNKPFDEHVRLVAKAAAIFIGKLIE